MYIYIYFLTVFFIKIILKFSLNSLLIIALKTTYMAFFLIIILKIQTILQKNLQTINVVNDYW